MTNQSRGIINGVVSGISFGLIPLFSIPVIAAGMGNVSILVYRFLFGSLGMLAMLLYRHVDLKVSLQDILRISVLSIFYNATAICTLECYHYLSSGVATALVFTDPIWCAIIGMLFLGQRLSWRVSMSLFMATMGVMLLTGVFTETVRFSPLGMFWGLMSGLAYALYLIFMPRLRMNEMPSLKLTFYVFFLGMIYLSIYDIVVEGGIQTITTSGVLLNLILLGLIPTALSNICVTMSVRLIDSTIVAILGAFEPLTAMVVGICILGEPFSWMCIMGAALILVAVGILSK